MLRWTINVHLKHSIDRSFNDSVEIEDMIGFGSSTGRENTANV